jgi:exodeoxyribonuclease VII large subunit
LNHQHPQNIIARLQNRYDNALQRLQQAAKANLDRRYNRLEVLSNQLKELSPNAILQRGYSFIQMEKKLVKSVKDMQPGAKVKLVFSDGSAQAEILDIEK